MCLHVSPGAATRSPVCAFTCLPGCAFICFSVLLEHVPSFVSQCCQPGRALASVHAYLSSSKFLGPNACRCAHVLVSPHTCFPARAFFVLSRCKIAGPHARQCSHLLVSRRVPSFVPQRCLTDGPHARHIRVCRRRTRVFFA